MTSAGFDWSDSVIWEGPGAIAGSEERLSADRLERAQYARFLTNYLAVEGKQRNYVLNLNAEWGAGKTWFIKRWYMELKAHYPTVYIDAWQQDFSDDPLLTVISSIIDQLKEVAGKDNKIPEGMRQRLLGLFKVGGKLALKAAIKKAGLEEDDFSLEGEDANQLVDALCSNQKERYESIQYLKQEIRQWVEGAVGLSERKLDFPAFILIDELDRCRPSYAVEMLETIKHIFDIPGVVFVLATDTEQLQHTIKVIYGEGFDAQTYLGRFFKRRFYLNKCPSYFLIAEFVSDRFELLCSKTFHCFSDVNEFSKIMAEIVDAFSLSAREIEAFLDTLFAILHSTSEGSIDIIYLSALVIMHSKNPLAYMTIRNGGELLEIELNNMRANRDSVFSFKNKIKLSLIVSYWSGVQSGRNEKVVWQTNDFYSYVLQVHKILDGYYSSSNGYKPNDINQLTYTKSGVRYDDRGEYYQVCLESKRLANSDYIELVELSTLLL
ncbi:P-loop NTPase fold protein [Aeromonas enteropelogenes]|uniref:KAP family P-loop NTPase fold protein n=1 Tax=Aeromonas enteropelogenes TaxID=29489 RepID=UPI0022864916|nr:P-loop NTPase fold protein [Aeromonas enteropelogenes]MCZ0750170.1 P-loop NTPase fold protein [Aeromonas enteropelogenes]